MKRSVLMYVFFIFCLVTLLTFSKNTVASENLELANGWIEFPYNDTVNFNSSGEILNVFATGKEAYAQWYKQVENGLGAMATIQVNNTDGDGDKMVGLRSYIGYWGDNRILVEIRVAEWNGEDRVINYRIRERDSEGNTIRIWTYGNIGNWTDEWDIGDKITIGFAILGSEIWFYGDGHKSKDATNDGNCFIKFQPFPTSFSHNMVPIEDPNIAIETYTQNNDDTVGAVVNNVFMIK